MNNVLKRIFDNSIPEPNSGCWLWEGKATTPGGYGRIRIGSLKDGSRRVTTVSRVVCAEIHGIDDNEFACHKCDNVICVNPDHIFRGTPKQNTNDARIKGRLHIGDMHPTRKLTSQQVVSILNDNRKLKYIASEYGVSIGHISAIKSGKKRSDTSINIRTMGRV